VRLILKAKSALKKNAAGFTPRRSIYLPVKYLSGDDVHHDAPHDANDVSHVNGHCDGGSDVNDGHVKNDDARGGNDDVRGGDGDDGDDASASSYRRPFCYHRTRNG